MGDQVQQVRAHEASPAATVPTSEPPRDTPGRCCGTANARACHECKEHPATGQLHPTLPLTSGSDTVPPGGVG
jgi:hypothetical protein